MPNSADRRISTWSRLRIAISSVLFIIGIPTAVVAFIALLPQAWSATHVRDTEAAKLRSIHAGFSAEYFEQVLGLPTIQHAEGDYTDEIFLGGEWIVMTSVNKSRQVVVMGILACDPEFTPTFDTPGNTTVTLNTSSIRDAEGHPAGSVTPAPPSGYTLPESPSDALAAVVGILSNRAGTSVDGLVLRSGVKSEAGSSGAPYLYGVSGTCGDEPNYYGNVNNISNGDHEVVKPSGYALVNAFLDSHSPNFYVESTVGSIGISSSGERACFNLAEEPTGSCVMPLFNRFELPPVVIRPPAPSWWENLPW